MALPDIRLISQIDETAPNGAFVSAAELDDYIKQLWGFLKNFLAVGHNDDGSILSVFANGRVPASTIDGQLTGTQIGAGEIEAVHLDEDSVLTDKIADNAVTNDKLADNAANTAQIADGAVTNAKLAGSITEDKLAGGIPAAKIAGLGGASIVDGSVTASKVAIDAALSSINPGLLAIAGATSESKLAQIGGVLQAVIDNTTTPPTLEFAFASALEVADGAVGLLMQSGNASPTITAGVNKRATGWSRVIGETFLEVGDTGGGTVDDLITITKTGTYFVFFYVPVTGNLGGAGTADIEAFLKIGSTTKTTSTKATTTSTNSTQYWVMGVTTIAVTEATGDVTFHLEKLVTDATGGSWSEGANGKNHGLIFLLAFA